MLETRSRTDHAARRRMLSDLDRICGFGGRLSGTRSETEAIDWLKEAASEALGVACVEHGFSYQGWRAEAASLITEDGHPLECHPLVRSVSTPEGGLTAEVLDLGRGLPEDFARHHEDLKGRIALFRHEVMFSAGTFHRREKLRLAREAGAVGALVSSLVEGELVTGSSRGEGEPGIPALGITKAAARRLTPSDESMAGVTMMVRAREEETRSRNLILDLPGEDDTWVVLSAHIDGHDIAEAAMDNASGVVVALEVARRMKQAAPHRHGLRLAFFSVEEWGLTGSDQYLESLPAEQLGAILLNINLDTVVGGSSLTALTSDFSGLPEFVTKATEPAGHEIAVHASLQRNSDHANFALRGIPAFRLLSGFDEPESDVRFVLTGQDKREKVDSSGLLRSVEVATVLTREALALDPSSARRWQRNPQM